MIGVGVSGAAGRMGRLTAHAVRGAEDLELVALFAPGHGGEAVEGAACSEDPEVLRDCDVIVEFTNPDVVEDNVTRWRSFGRHVLVGTSGYSEDRLTRLRDTWGSGPPNCLVVPNFAIGAVLMMRFAELAAPHFESVEIVEMHHEDKPDAPSGTALNTAARVARARAGRGHGRGRELVAGALGADVEGVPVHSIRLAGAVAHQEVVLGTTGQYLGIRHDTTDYSAFAPGIVLGVRSVAGLADPVTVGLESLLGV